MLIDISTEGPYKINNPNILLPGVFHLSFWLNIWGRNAWLPSDSSISFIFQQFLVVFLSSECEISVCIVYVILCDPSTCRGGYSISLIWRYRQCCRRQWSMHNCTIARSGLLTVAILHSWNPQVKYLQLWSWISLNVTYISSEAYSHCTLGSSPGKRWREGHFVVSFPPLLSKTAQLSSHSCQQMHPLEYAYLQCWYVKVSIFYREWSLSYVVNIVLVSIKSPIICSLMLFRKNTILTSKKSGYDQKEIIILYVVARSGQWPGSWNYFQLPAGSPYKWSEKNMFKWNLFNTHVKRCFGLLSDERSSVISHHSPPPFLKRLCDMRAPTCDRPSFSLQLAFWLVNWSAILTADNTSLCPVMSERPARQVIRRMVNLFVPVSQHISPHFFSLV